MLMILSMPSECCQGLQSRSQMARRVTEEWAASQLYCPACPSKRLAPTTANTRAIDFRCKMCDSPFQLKAGRSPMRGTIPDGAHAAMIEAIRSDSTPHLLLLHYTESWTVRNLTLVPSFFVTESIIQKRPPLPETARRKGWVGCNLRVGAVAPDGRLPIVANAVASPPHEVRAAFDRVRAIQKVSPTSRGWMTDVLAVVRRLGPRFALEDVYRAGESELSALHPENRNVRPKIRQQLQVLRDAGLIRFEGRGRYLEF
jgi:type II restriction enzyme